MANSFQYVPFLQPNISPSLNFDDSLNTTCYKREVFGKVFQVRSDTSLQVFLVPANFALKSAERERRGYLFLGATHREIYFL